MRLETGPLHDLRVRGRVGQPSVVAGSAVQVPNSSRRRIVTRVNSASSCSPSAKRSPSALERSHQSADGGGRVRAGRRTVAVVQFRGHRDAAEEPPEVKRLGEGRLVERARPGRCREGGEAHPMRLWRTFQRKACEDGAVAPRPSDDQLIGVSRSAAARVIGITERRLVA